MGGNQYSLATLWQKLAFKFILIGFELVILAFATNLYGEGNADVEALFLIGFVAYLLALVMIMFLIWLSEYTENRPLLWTSLAAALSLIAAVLLVAGVIVQGVKYWEQGLKAYSTTFLMAGAGMALFGTVWLIIEACNHRG